MQLLNDKQLNDQDYLWFMGNAIPSAWVSVAQSLGQDRSLWWSLSVLQAGATGTCRASVNQSINLSINFYL